MKNGEIEENTVLSYILAGAIIIVVGLIAITNLFHYCYKMNADIASEAVLARLIWESREWIPKTWYPSTELRILGTPALASLFYGIMPDMSLAMGAACTAMMAGILLSAYYFIAQFSFSRLQKLIFLLLCLCIPNHFITLELFYIFAGYYAIHVIVTFLTLGVYARLTGRKKVSYIWLMLTLLLSFVMGMQGIRGILVLSGPLVVIEAVRQSYLVYIRQWKDKRNLITGSWCIMLLLIGYVGTRVPFSVEQEGVSRNIRKGSMKLWQIVLPDVLACLGWTEADAVGKILLFILLTVGIFGLFCCVKQIIIRRVTDASVWIYLMLWGSPVITMLVASFTTAESSQRYYFMFLFALAFGFTEFIKSTKIFVRGGVRSIITFADGADLLCIFADHKQQRAACDGLI